MLWPILIEVHSEVHKAIQKSTSKVVALKRILMHNEKEGMPVTALREIKILKALKHPCIVNILDMFVVQSVSPPSTDMSRRSHVVKAIREIRSLYIWFFPTWTTILRVFLKMNASSYSLVISNYI